MTSCISNILLDRDGTVIKDMHYLSDWRDIELLPDVAECLGRLAGQKGMRFFLVSNQSGVGRGMFSNETVERCNERVAELLAPHGVRFSDMLFCPHLPEDGCTCRKPGVGMWQTLKLRHALKEEASLMVGDKDADLRFAAHAGLALRALVLTGKGMNVARQLGMALSGPDALCFVEEPDSSGHPHLVLGSFSMLEHGLELYGRSRDRACGV